jgi:hypothetical protein
MSYPKCPRCHSSGFEMEHRNTVKDGTITGSLLTADCSLCGLNQSITYDAATGEIITSVTPW